MKAINKLVSALFLFAAVLLVKAAPEDEIPPIPGGTDDSGTGTTGPGGLSSPIDMYIFALSVVAVIFIVYYTKKYKSVKA
ncbi:MAG: signal peptidase [Chryseobacterium sp.]|jgi:hypothetical protein|uniref:signal peptidase n=1 Tax=Chryseobacterium sp. TaxID=1871047 RepID=UPI0028262503|nr:signal peptidase [Chryseobacterium sp.]MDR2237178.1 signal peptidase [Chryseobacterium sp.]